MKNKLKHTLTLLLSLAMIFSMVTCVSAAGEKVTLKASAQSVVAGDEVTVIVSVNGADKATSAGVSVTYGDNFELVSGEWLLTGGLMSNYDVSKNKGVFAFASATDMNGDLFKLTLKAKTIDTTAQTVSINVQLKNGGQTVLDQTAETSVSIVEKPKKNFTGITFTGATYTYDGKEHALAISGKLPAGATVEYDNEKASAAGTYNATATVRADGYNDLVQKATLKINPKELTVTGLVAQNKTYDGTTDATVTGGALNGVVSGDNVSLGLPAKGTFAKASVGTGIAVSIGTVTLNGDDKDNYSLKQPAALKANITAAPLKVKADDITIMKGAKVPELTYQFTEGKLFGNDQLTGALATKANGTKVGTFDITQGTLKATSNYNLQFTKGTLTVADRKTQNITVSAITDKTYGDQGFTVNVTPDSASGLSDFTFASSNPTVAAIDAQGNVTVKNAGTTVISVKQAGNDDYAPFEKKQTLTVNKVAITVTADAKSKKIGSADPELTYTYTGNLVGNDAFTGKLSRKAGEKVGKYDILQGTLALSANYTITYNKAVFEIFDKTPQNITVSEITGKTYGDESFRITVTPDENAKLSDFTFESSDKTVATIAADGTVTIVGAGETEITVKQAGNADYAPFTGTQKLTVAPKAVAITAINLEAETVTFDTEFEKVTLDFTALVIGKPEQVDEETSKVTLSNFVLTGENAKNYTVSNKSFETTIANESLITVSVTAENGTITGNGTYVKGSEVTLTAQPKSGYRLDGWYIGSKRVSTETTYTFKAGETIPTVKFAKKSSGGSSSGSAGGSGSTGGSTATTTYTVRFESNMGSFVSDRKVTQNGILAKPEDPVRKGFIFDGWYTDAGLTTAYDFNTRVNANFTLYAKWTEEKADVWANPFADVSENEWFYGAVEYAAKNGLMNGVSDNEFAPNAALTRAMFVTVLYRMENEPETANAAFTDVVSGSWYEKAVAWAYAGGLVTGVSETEFAPEDTITREQMAAILYRYAKFKGMDVSVRGETSYTDKDAISDYAADAVIWAATKAVMSGNADGSFAPADNATRAEAAAVFMRIQEILK